MAPRPTSVSTWLRRLYLALQGVEALALCEQILADDPKRVAALTLAAKCLERLNRIDEAILYAQRAVEQGRNDPDASLVLAKLEARRKNLPSARERLERLAARSGIAPDIHHQALTELGFVLDKLGEYDAAFDAFTRAGREIGATPAVQQVNRRVAFQKLDLYRDRLTGEDMGRFAGESFDTPAPAFLVGFPRSGTTMTEQVLAAHPGVMTTEEEPLIIAAGRRLMASATNKLDVPAQLKRVDRGTVAEVRRAYWEGARETLGVDLDGRLLVDKLPLNIIDLGMINTVFPDAKVLVALRDPRDVCLSCFMQWFAPNPAMVQLLSLPSSAEFYAAVMGLYLHQRPMFTMPVLQVRYEDTVTDLESQARRIVEHMGLGWSDELLSFHEKASERFIRTPSYAAVTEKVHTRAVGRWRNYTRHFEPLQAKLAPFVAEFGYEPA
ncbi:MAG: sulfotransferase [Phycisphaerales bacterium]